ncbi:sulfatase-like hydrolase/transferase [Paenibacillus cremeus]|uniref:Sulfatase-like hydrolase/transferase n=1 Tax=Paenibacillus cremeus TaxID=2163881 RepID=A0A559KBF1_9BACL|nr:sulfatase-like hydrolase/transferase [Paenibacillus cremeus]TVY09460.1 sulfatase-like hydrolase/transferase [Paenibacillus cremeus]
MSSASALNNQPNILIFMPDQMQAQVTLPGHLCHMPNVNRLASEGVSFTYAYPPMAHCCPARASFMTGLYPTQHGVFNNVSNDQALRTTLNDGVEMFSEKLQDVGYQLFYSGKWHVSATEMPRDRGWAELHMREQKLDHGSRREAFRKLKADKAEADRERGEIARPGWGSYRLYGTSDERYEDTKDYRTVQAAIEQLDRLKDSSDPWCMFVGPTAPHDPFIVPEKYAKMYDPSKVQLPPNFHDDMKDKPGIYRRMKSVFSQLTEDEVKESIAHYWGFCTMVDDLFGEVLEALERNGQLDNTIVMFVSDHGEHAGAHGLYCKGISTFDEGYRVPFIIRAPQLAEHGGRAMDEFVSLMDAAPTILELAGAQPLGKCSGLSLVPFLRGTQPERWRDSLFTQCNGTELYYINRMVKTKRYKFVYNPSDLDELYDLQADPHELVNIADHPGMEGIVKEMYTRMWEHAFSAEDNCFVRYIPVTTAQYGPYVVSQASQSQPSYT